MKFIPHRNIGSEKWDAVCASSSNAWFRHTNNFIDFSLTLGVESRNMSFAVVDDSGRFIALVPLLLQRMSENGMGEFAMGGTPIPFPAFGSNTTHDERMEAIVYIMQEIDSLAAANDVVRIRMFVDPLTDPIMLGQMITNPFTPFGFRDDSIETTTVDLVQNGDDMFNRIAKGHRSDIHFAQKQAYRVDIFDRDAITDELCDCYKELYFAAAERVVGTPQRWEKTFQQIKDGYGVLILGREEREEAYIAGNIVLAYRKRAYYALSATLREKKMRGLGALMQWETMNYLKRNNGTHYELGWLASEESSQKEKDIAHFKSLFGGDRLPVFRGTKEYR
jgi:hypothetical protein